MDLLALSPVAAQKVLSSSTWRPFTGATGFLIDRRKARALSLAAVCASGKKKNNNPASSGNGDPSLPGGDSKEGSKPLNDKSKSKEPKSQNTASDWRDFRANLVAREENILLAADPHYKGPIEPQVGQLDPMWAHPIAMPEPGCLLLATQEIDQITNFSRSVVLLLSLGSQTEGPIGIILNRPLDKKVRNLPVSNPNFTANFANHPLHYGGPLGPLDISMFLVKMESGLIGAAYQSGFEKVINGVHFGGRDKIEEAAALAKGGVVSSNDFKFFVGYASWTYDQLLGEIERGYWVVAAPSSRVIGRAVSEASDRLWEEVLGIMGGKYEEMSRKPRKDE
ncbi:hypothetical protein LUZ60_001890 [Juncus effusus]|nr:hypothetical protein LUZ60_001890 [Juncus effusus]